MNDRRKMIVMFDDKFEDNNLLIQMDICFYLINQTLFFRILQDIASPSSCNLNRTRSEIFNILDRKSLAPNRAFYLADSLKQLSSLISSKIPSVC